jgi:spore coat polysaccharide biosynthesis protein SpsF (cytidylyltransferase family)
MQKNLKVSNFQNDKNYSKLRWTLDTMEDYNKLNNMFEKFKLKTSYSWKKILNYENS